MRCGRDWSSDVCSSDLNGTLRGTTAYADALTLRAGTGNLTFTNAVGGGGKQLGDVNIDNAAQVLASSTFAAKSLTQTTGSGPTTFDRKSTRLNSSHVGNSYAAISLAKQIS